MILGTSTMAFSSAKLAQESGADLVPGATREIAGAGAGEVGHPARPD